MPSPWRLEGRRALVTGATKGIGLAVAEELLRLGAEVILVARTEADVSARAAALGERARGVVGDVVTDAGRRAAVAAAGERLDILVNNVGTNIRRSSLDYETEQLATVLATNISAAWELCRLAHPLLKAAGSAAIVNIGSVASTRVVRTGAPYAMSKAALDQMTRYLAVEWAGDGIRVNSVNPWYTFTPLVEKILANPEFRERVLARTPLGRIAEPAEIAAPVAFLCTPAASYVTGQCLLVDGGFSAMAL